MKFSYPKEKVPYLGIWINNDGYYKQRNVALEPCTAAPDAIDMADTSWVGIYYRTTRKCELEIVNRDRL